MRWKLWISLMITFATSMCSSTTSTDDLAEGFFAHLNSVKDGVYSRQNVTAQTLNAITKAAKMFAKVMKGQVAFDDPNVAEVEELSKKFSEKLEETKWSITRSGQFNLPNRIYKSFSDFERNSNRFAERQLGILGVLYHNVSADILERHKNYCRYQKKQPDNLISEMSGLLTFSCEGRFSEDGKLRYAQILADFHYKQFTVRTQSALAFFSAVYERVSINDIISRFMNSYKRLETYRISEDSRQERAIREVGTREEYEPYCFLDAIYYNNLCEKKKLTNIIAAMEKVFLPIIISSTICNALEYDGYDRLLELMEKNLNEFRESMDTYYQDAMDNSFQLCEPTAISSIIEQFSTGPVDAKDYQKLGDHILKEVKLFGKPELNRHIVVTSNVHANTNYFYRGPANRTTVIRGDTRQVTVFYTYNEASKETLHSQELFLNSSKVLIDQVMEDFNRSNRIDDITNRLSARNISLTSAAPNRYSSELWIRDFSYTGDCSVKDSLSFEENSSAHYLLTYKWRNDKNPFKACEVYKIYLFP